MYRVCISSSGQNIVISPESRTVMKVQPHFFTCADESLRVYGGWRFRKEGKNTNRNRW